MIPIKSDAPKPEDWIPLLREARSSIIKSYATEGPEGPAARTAMEDRLNQLLRESLLADRKFKPLPVQHVCQVMSLVATLQFRKHNELILVEQQVSVFAKITPLRKKDSTEVLSKLPLLEVAFYQHVDPFVEYAIILMVASVDPAFIRSAHPYTRPAAI